MPVSERDLTGAPARDARSTRATPLAAVRATFPWVGVVAPWLLSRVLSIVTMFAAVNDPFRGSRLTQVVRKWDGDFYVQIARSGYGLVHTPPGQLPRWPFFPGLPAVIRVLGHVADDQVMIFVVNQLAFLVALAGLYRLATRHGGRRVAALSVWALALFPASFVFSMTYPSSIFLAVTVWGFLLVELRTTATDIGAGLLAAVGASVRPNGIVVAIALVVAVRTWRRALIVAGPAVLVVAAWCWYCWDRTGDALVFLSTKSRWQEITLTGLATGSSELKKSLVPHLVLAVAAVVAVILQRRRLPVSWLAFVALYLLPSFQLGMVGLGRYANECFPPFVAAGQIIEGWSRRAWVLLYGASAVGLVVFAFTTARYGLVP